jgi:RNA polymerase sigma factor (sigma-70 family)
MTLKKSILSYQKGNKDSFIEILNKFQFTIKKFAKKLNYEDAELDLTLYLLELTNSINLDNFKIKSDGALIKYIYLSLKNKSTKLYKSDLKIKNESIELDYKVFSQNAYIQHNDVELVSFLNCLNNIQKKIIINKYINNLTDTEIASKLGISRQSVHNNKLKSLNKLKKYII